MGSSTLYVNLVLKLISIQWHLSSWNFLKIYKNEKWQWTPYTDEKMYNCDEKLYNFYEKALYYELFPEKLLQLWKNT